MLKEKLEIARNLRDSSLRRSKNSSNKKLAEKCYRTFVIQCIFLGKDKYQLKFKGKHIKSFWERVTDWFDYIVDNIERYLWLIFIPKRFRPRNKYPFLYYKIHKPLHLKISNTPNEFILYSYLEQNGLKVVNEHFPREDIVYIIAHI